MISNLPFFFLFFPLQYYLELNQPYQVDNTDSTFLSCLQSPDYSVKVREGSPTVDEDGYELPFSPSPCGAVALPFSDTFEGHLPQTPRHTVLQMAFLENYAGPAEDSAGTYLSMSTPGPKDQIAFDFDAETVRCITKRDSEAYQQSHDPDADETDGLREVNYLSMDTSSKPSTPLHEESPVKPKISLRHKVVRQASEIEKHDSGLYSPTALQNNPNYMMMNSFLKTDESNYLTREDAFDLKKDGGDPEYMNYDTVKKVTGNNTLPRNYPKEGATDAEYANLLLNSESRGRTISEASSGVGSLPGESPPAFSGKPIMGDAIMEEPVAA